MYPDLAGKVAVVTGASKGIGRSIAIRFGQERMKVIINYTRDFKSADEVVAEIRQSGGEAIACCADVSTETEVKQLLRTAVDTFGTLDVWINNAGIQTTAPSHELQLEEWYRVLNTNLTGAFVGCREALSYMLQNNKKGNIVNVSSVHQRIPKPQHVHYAASKGGMRLMTETLAREYASRGIRVNSIAPGAMETPMNEHILADAQNKADILSLIPMNRIGEPKEAASVVTWLVSAESSYVTGITLFVDGGMTLC